MDLSRFTNNPFIKDPNLRAKKMMANADGRLALQAYFDRRFAEEAEAKGNPVKAAYLLSKIPTEEDFKRLVSPEIKQAKELDAQTNNRLLQEMQIIISTDPTLAQFEKILEGRPDLRAVMSEYKRKKAYGEELKVSVELLIDAWLNGKFKSVPLASIPPAAAPVPSSSTPPPVVTTSRLASLGSRIPQAPPMTPLSLSAPDQTSPLLSSIFSSTPSSPLTTSASSSSSLQSQPDASSTLEEKDDVKSASGESKDFMAGLADQLQGKKSGLKKTETKVPKPIESKIYDVKEKYSQKANEGVIESKLRSIANSASLAPDPQVTAYDNAKTAFGDDFKFWDDLRQAYNIPKYTKTLKTKTGRANYHFIKHVLSNLPYTSELFGRSVPNIGKGFSFLPTNVGFINTKPRLVYGRGIEPIKLSELLAGKVSKEEKEKKEDEKKGDLKEDEVSKGRPIKVRPGPQELDDLIAADQIQMRVGKRRTVADKEYSGFGKYKISMDDFEKKIFKIYYQDGYQMVHGFKTIKLSDALHKVLISIMKYKSLPIEYNELTFSEKEFLAMLLKKSGVGMLVKLPHTPNDPCEKECPCSVVKASKPHVILKKRFEVLTGEIKAGNDNPQIKNQLADVILEMLEREYISENQAYAFQKAFL